MDSTQKPSVQIFYDKNLSDIRRIDYICFGLEEEGVPFETAPKNESSNIELSYNASLSSRVEVGIGVSLEYVTLHYRKLDKEKPLFTIKLNSEIENLRRIGVNAARLLKGIPFKELIVNN